MFMKHLNINFVVFQRVERLFKTFRLNNNGADNN